MEKRKVLIVKGDGAGEVAAMFARQGWDITSDIEEADLVQFVGGADVSPSLYGQHKHPTTSINAERDIREQALYTMALDRGLPMAGICRGGQFLNVMNGGDMYQDVNNHALGGTHDAYLRGATLPIRVTSTHHQMMAPNYEADLTILLTAKEATFKTRMSLLAYNPYELTMPIVKGIGSSVVDMEACFYHNTRCLCFQPHPEYSGPYAKDTLEAYFSFLEEFCIDKEDASEDAVAS